MHGRSLVETEALVDEIAARVPVAGAILRR